MISSDHSPTPAILQIVPSLDTGGAERTTIDIAAALVRDGLAALVASEGGRLEPILAGVGGRLIRMPVASKALPIIIANATRLARLVRQRNVKLIHARSRAPAWSAALAARMASVPFVTTYHGIYNASNRMKRFYNSVMVRSDAIIANSEWTAAHIAREHRVARDRIIVIPRGVDLAEFDPAGVTPGRIESLRARWGVRDGETVILLPGRLTRWKGQLVFIEALAQLVRGRALSNVRAVLAGDAQGRDDYAAELRDAIARAGLADRVVIAGHVADMPAAYLASDIVISASTDPEAFGRVAAEAGAMGRPVIATDHGGARETVLADISGLLVSPGDAAALAGALSTMIGMSAEGRAEMGGRGREHVREHFSLDRMCAETIAVYRRLMAG
jgi:glycosyltransferase involved in cell wall biosynthesis